uniref:Uncharacterized protein n=1 Tax=Arundo donax TaxID=35708 RepID=A0A0A9C0E2_ARUDO
MMLMLHRSSTSKNSIHEHNIIYIVCASNSYFTDSAVDSCVNVGSCSR